MVISIYAAIAIDLKVLLERQINNIATFIRSTDKIITKYLDLSNFYTITAIFYVLP
jgi:hypothetical protein